MAGSGNPSAYTVTAVHDPVAMRQAGADLLSLALMDARNRTLGWLAVMAGASLPPGVPESLDPPAWLAGQAGWFQERWIARHVQRGRGAAADPQGLRLPSVEPSADPWFDPALSNHAQRWALPLRLADVRDYLSKTLDGTLDLLDRTTDDDDGLYVFRLALAHEDRLGEAMAALAQGLDLPPEHHAQASANGLWPELPSRGRREPLSLAGQRWLLGSAPGGWVPEAERWAHAVQVPSFEIDAQPVAWAQFSEFIDDGGYDDRRLWSAAGWRWLQRDGVAPRRAPRYVAQVTAGVMAQRQGRLQRLPAAQTVLHVSVHEAEAWCRWAGRRLPTEAEWELAACSAAGRGFVWGDGLEWVLGTARPFPGATETTAALDALPANGGLAVLRGASAFGSPRLHHPRARRYCPGEYDTGFTSFRSCAA